MALTRALKTGGAAAAKPGQLQQCQVHCKGISLPPSSLSPEFQEVQGIQDQPEKKKGEDGKRWEKGEVEQKTER